MPSWTTILVHVLAYPAYQVLGTIRHEACHAIVAKLHGAEITKFRWYPERVEGVFFWGYVRWLWPDAEREELLFAFRAPYLVNIILIVIGAMMFAFVEIPNDHWWMVTLILLVISPAVDTLYNMVKGWRGYGDFSRIKELEGK